MDWISIEERLPDEKVLVEFWGPDQGQGHEIQEDGYYYKESRVWLSRVDAIMFHEDEITKWSLPDLPEGFTT